MTATVQQQVGLFNLLLYRGQNKLLGLSMSAMVRTLELDDEGHLMEALKALEEGKLIRVDIWAKSPAIVVLKDKWRNGADIFLPVPPGAEPLVTPKHDSVPTKAVEPVKMPPRAAAPFDSAVTAAAKLEAVRPAEKRSNSVSFIVTADHTAWLSEQHAKFGADLSYSAFCRALFLEAIGQIKDAAEKPALVLEPADAPNLISIPVTDCEMEALHEALDVHDGSIALPAFAKHLLLTELGRLRSADAPKHKISADIVLAAQEDGRPVLEFVAAMIEVGMTARAMNRKGF